MQRVVRDLNLQYQYYKTEDPVHPDLWQLPCHPDRPFHYDSNPRGQLRRQRTQ